MSADLHVHDLQQLQMDGYEVQEWQGYAILRHVPYLNTERQLCYGAFACPFSRTSEPKDHIMHFSGSFPCDINGKEMPALLLDKRGVVLDGLKFERRFSNKPVSLNGGIFRFTNYEDKFRHYLKVVCAPALAIYPEATAKTYKPIKSSESSSFVYADTNASRANLVNVNEKVGNLRIGIVGIGGTGSYVLDLVAKMPVSEIHLFDGDDLLQHNAFRAPGAVPEETFSQRKKKVEYFKTVYDAMHRGIFPHTEYIDEDNISQLFSLDFVFICMDAGRVKPLIISALVEERIPFVDCGIDVQVLNGQIQGMVRCTLGVPGIKMDILRPHIPMMEMEDEDLYASNIQIAELNSLAAIHAVIRWKQYYGLYQDLRCAVNSVYTSIDGVMNHA